MSFINQKEKPAYVQQCGEKYTLPHPETNEPRVLTKTCNNFRLCFRCRKFREDAHREALGFLAERDDTYLLIANSVKGVKRLKRDVKPIPEEEYRRYPLHDGLAYLVLGEYESDYYRIHGGYEIHKLTDRVAKELVEKLVKTPERKRISGRLYQTNERGKKDDDGNTIPISIYCPKVIAETDAQRHQALRALAKTLYETANWKPDEETVETHMQAFQNRLKENYIVAGLRIDGGQRFRLRVDPEQIHWIGYDNMDTVMSIQDSLLRTVMIDLIEYTEENPMPKLPEPNLWGITFGSGRT